MRSTLIAAAAAFCLTAGVAPSAYADTLVREDAPRDVVRLELSGGGEPQIERAPRKFDPDVRRVAVDHRDRFLLVRVKYAGLDRRVWRGENVTVRTSGGRVLMAMAFVIEKGRWQGFTSLEDVDLENTPDCRALRHHFDYGANVGTWSIPRSCLGNPRWVRVGVSASRGAPRGPVYLDDAFRKGFDFDRPIESLSRRIWRG